MLPPQILPDFILGISKDTWSVLGPVFGVVVGVVITGLFNYFQAGAARKSEERRHHLELVFNTALEHWKQANSYAHVQQERGIPSSIPPLEAFLIHSLLIFEMMETPGLNESNVAERLKRIQRVTLAVSNEVADRAQTVK